MMNSNRDAKASKKEMTASKKVDPEKIKQLLKLIDSESGISFHDATANEDAIISSAQKNQEQRAFPKDLSISSIVHPTLVQLRQFY